MLLLLWLACKGDAVDDSAPDTSVSDPVDDSGDSSLPERPGLLRLGPSQPAVGIYGIAATQDQVYLSNLHVPFVTLIDPETGANLGGVEVRTPSGERPMFARLGIVGQELWITAANEDRVLRLSLPDHERLDDLELPQGATAFRFVEDGLWVGYPEGATKLVGEGEGDSVELAWRIGALDVAEGLVAGVDAVNQRVELYDLAGERQWATALAYEELGDVRIVDGAVFVTDRQSGAVVKLVEGSETASVVTGSDTFAITPFEGDLLITNRQGAELPASGAYEGAPGRLTRLTTELEELWTVDLDKTIHFVAFDGSRLWLANEDALTVSAVDPSTGEETLRGPRVGLTLDHLQVEGSGAWAGSHLTDELWWADFEAPEARSVEVCGWPFQLVPEEGGAASGWVPCQESGELALLSEGEVVDTLPLQDTFHAACADGLCVGHAALVGGVVHEGERVIGDPHSGGLVWEGGGLAFETSEVPESVRHFGLVSLGETLLALDPRDGQLHAIQGEEIQASILPEGELGEWPLIADGEGAWSGRQRFDASLSVTDEAVGTVVAAGQGFVVSLEERELVSQVDGVERARLALDELRVPPIEQELAGEPLRFAITDGGELWVATVFQGVIERRGLPDLEPLGHDEIVVVGPWE